MNTELVEQQDLLLRVADQLSRMRTTTDHLMLTKWRVLSACQYLLGRPEQELAESCRAAVEAFVVHGPGAACDKALEVAGATIKRIKGNAETVLPTISKEKRTAVAGHLDSLVAAGATAIERALRVLPAVRERMQAAGAGSVLPGIRHRFELVANIVGNPSRPEAERLRAAAGVLYVDEVRDVIPDTLNVIGMLDDDYALRVVLEEIEGDLDGFALHWSEKISSLWDDLPFLQGVNLQRGDSPISVTWLDRVNSYVSYSHVMGPGLAPLVLLQPSVSCSPLHAIVSLVGLLVLDAVTSSECKGHVLHPGQTYEIDGFVVRFEGIAGPPMQGWLRLRMREGVKYEPPALADRMVPVDECRLSSMRDFTSRRKIAGADPMQRFFAWDAAIGPASISSRLVVVTSRQRATELLEGVQSNGVRLLDHGLVQFVGALPDNVETHGTLVLIVPSLSATRILLDQGIRVQAVLVDGYDRLHRGRHELPFLINRQDAPPIISWSPSGYYPAKPPTWLPPHKRLEVSCEDLTSILELDDSSDHPEHASLWEAATGGTVQVHGRPIQAAEAGIVSALDIYLTGVSKASALPEYWRYHIESLARTLKMLLIATPAEWGEIKRFALLWSSSMDEKWTDLRTSAAESLAGLREQEKCILDQICAVPDAINSRASGLVAFLGKGISEQRRWAYVCDGPEQTKAAASLFRSQKLSCIEPVLLRDLAVCRDVLVTGWVSRAFARRLWAHTPKSLVAIVDEEGSRKWENASEDQRRSVKESLLGAIGAIQRPSSAPNVEHSIAENDGVDEFRAEGLLDEARIPCIFLWVTGESRAKVLDPNGRVIVEEGEVVCERPAARLCPDDRVILGLGTARWSPAEEFTATVVDAVEASHPELVRTAKEWRRALRDLTQEQALSASELRARLATVGVQRELQTIEGWLDCQRSSPIAPKGMRSEMALLWPLIAGLAKSTLDDTVSACTQLRTLRMAASRALLQLWKGRRGHNLDIDDSSLDELVERLRQEVQVYEVEAVTLGEVPAAMLGWWIPASLAGVFESENIPLMEASDATGEGESELS